MKYIFILSLVIVTITSCKKKEVHFVIKGTITDNSFNTPLTNVTAYLFKIPAGTSQEELVT